MSVPLTNFAPDYRIEINGGPIPDAMRACVTRVSYQDGIEGADRVEITLANPTLEWLDDVLLQVDNGFKLAIGYAPFPLDDVFVGEITGVSVSFPNSGVPTVTVVAHDFLQRLTTGTKDRAFALSLPCIGKFPLPDPLIAGLVSFTNLLIPSIDPAGAALSFLTLLIAYALDPLEAKRGVRIQQGHRGKAISISCRSSPRTMAGRCTLTTQQHHAAACSGFSSCSRITSPPLILNGDNR
jgi:hypothetical protein